jgi:hypothetical protein
MGACATKSGDLKVKGEPPLVVEDGTAAPLVAEGEKANKADVSRRRSLSYLLKEVSDHALELLSRTASFSTGRKLSRTQASDEEAGQEAVKVVTVDSAGASATGEDGAPASLLKEADEAEQLTDDPKFPTPARKPVATRRWPRKKKRALILIRSELLLP